MKFFFDQYIKQNYIFLILTFVCVAFLVAGLIFPPPGEVHNSVLLAVAEIIAVMALWTLIFAIEKGADAKLTKGDMTIEINNPNDTGDRHREEIPESRLHNR